MSGRRAIGCGLIIALLIVACDSAAPGGGAIATADPALRGGTLRLAAPFLASDDPPALLLDAALAGNQESNEILRCCLERTLLSHRGAPTEKGGFELLPDLADGLPTISADSLTWTFHLRKGVHYAPPLQRIEVSSADIIRALKRVGKLGLPDFFDVIAGMSDFAAGKAGTISGLKAPDTHTLTVHLTQPSGDIGEFFALPVTAPIAPLPNNPKAELGVATGHDDGDSGFLVATGPYMIEGAERIDFSRPAGQQKPASGLVANRSLTLVRNPSWQSAIDALRPAYANRIVLTSVETPEEAADGIDKGTYDLVFTSDPDFPPPDTQTSRYAGNSHLGHIELSALDALRSMPMNVAVPPLDDVHVRRAVNWIIDKAAILDVMGGSHAGALIGHVVLDSLEDDALVNYAPFRTPGDHGDVAAARREMALSPYDTNHDGICDAAVCSRVSVATVDAPGPRRIAASIAADLAKIGITLDLHFLPNRQAMYAEAFNPPNHVGFIVLAAWFKDLPAPSNFFVVFSSQAIGAGASMLLGAQPDQLRAWGYSAPSVPSVDDRIAECAASYGLAATRCWTALDQFLSEKVVPTVPIVVPYAVSVVPSRVVRFSYDQAWDIAALDQVAVKH